MDYLKFIITELALSNIEEIATYYEAKQIGLGSRFVKYYYDQVLILSTMPNIGRMGKVFGTRELVLHEFPYFIVYRVRKDYIQILRIFHQHRQYP
jgi:toxin ParE1/3/4